MKQDNSNMGKDCRQNGCCKNGKDTGKHVSPFDTYALEMATRLKEAVGGSITAITSPLLDTSFPLAVLKMGGFVPLPLWDGL